jgi:type IV pilus assembly protein PilY1
MNSIRFKSWLLAAALLATSWARAADIDLFAGSAPTGTNAPDVLFVVDTGAAFSAAMNGSDAFRCNISSSGVVATDGTGLSGDFTQLDKSAGGAEQCALYSVFKSLAASTITVNVGVMMMNSGQATYDPATNSFSTPCKAVSPVTGGCLVMPLVDLKSNVTNILSWVKQWTTSGNNNWNIKAPNNRGDGATMQEAWAYLTGHTGSSQRAYTAPNSSSCANKYIIYLGNNWPSANPSPKDDTSSVSPKTRLNGTYGVTAQNSNPAATTTEYALVSYTQPKADAICVPNAAVVLDASEGNGGYALNWAYYMKNQHGITTFAAAMESVGCNVNYGAFLPALAEKGGGQFYAVNSYQGLVDALKTTFSTIASVNSVFAAVSLPVSVNTQGTYLDEIYVGMFRPGQSFLPRWYGNLKQYKLGLNSSGVLKLEDADSNLAINTQTGFITECARSYWTPTTADSYWQDAQSGGCLTVTGANSSNYPDGNIVEKGAQAYKVRGLSPSARVVKTCSTTFSGCTTMTDFTTTNATVTASLSADLINWTRGTNLDNELSMGTTTMRASVHGDVVHSRPVPVNYGTDAAPQVVVYYGANDGMLRAVNGNRGSSTYTVTGQITSGGNTYEAGQEIWSFIPPESYSILQRLRDDTDGIQTPATSSNLSHQKAYGVDGPITAFQGTIGGSSKVYIYATMRRGGRVVYAFDTTTPASPTLLWKKGCPNLLNDTSCSTGFTGIGQTWASLKTLYATGYGSGSSPLLITGGGYDTCEDYDGGTGAANHNCTGTTKGNRVYVLDAATGAVVKEFGSGAAADGTIDRAVIADVTIVRDTSTGKIKYGYTADMGGNVYRMTFGSGAASTWTITKIASLGCNTLGTCTANRKFMFAPSVVTTDNDTYFLMLGSGDREKPVTTYTASTGVTNYFFMIKDTISAGAAGYADTANCGASTTVLCLSSLTAIGASDPTQAQLDAHPHGWYLALASTEQVVTSAVTIFGVVTFSTHQPAGAAVANSCKPNLGTTNVYNISYLNAATANGTSARYEHVSGDGLPPSPVAGQVTLDNGTTVPFCIGCSKDSPLEGAPPRTLSSVSQPTNRLYWYIQK